MRIILVLPMILIVCMFDSYDACNCVRIKDCGPIKYLLLHHKPKQRQTVFAVVHEAACGFQGLDPLVCCPTTATSRNSAITRMMRFTMPKEGIFNFEESLHDYVDFKSQKNCPKPMEYDFRFQVNHHHHHHHDDDGDDDDDDGEGDYGWGGRRDNPEDRPIIFPGDLRFEAAATSTQQQQQQQQQQPVVLTNDPNCGIRVNSRLFGGQEATASQYPWLARIAYRNTSDNRISYRCSGSVVSNNYVLTAAHCVVNLVNDLELSFVRVSNCDSSECGSSSSSVGNEFTVLRVSIHPNYDQPKYANDIALLRINNPQFNLTSICLPLNATLINADLLVGQTGVAAGWSTTATTITMDGSETDESNGSSVRFIRLPIVNTTGCAIAYASLSENFQQPIVVTPNHLCAQGNDMEDVCRGDSGGPFMDDGTSGLIDRNGRHTLLGIVAFGPTLCGVTTIPGVYTRVSAFVPWIINGIRN